MWYKKQDVTPTVAITFGCAFIGAVAFYTLGEGVHSLITQFGFSYYMVHYSWATEGIQHSVEVVTKLGWGNLISDSIGLGVILGGGTTLATLCFRGRLFRSFIRNLVLMCGGASFGSLLLGIFGYIFGQIWPATLRNAFVGGGQLWFDPPQTGFGWGLVWGFFVGSSIGGLVSVSIDLWWYRHSTEKMLTI